MREDAGSVEVCLVIMAGGVEKSAGVEVDVTPAGVTAMEGQMCQMQNYETPDSLSYIT